jgi:hypothetical protein
MLGFTDHWFVLLLFVSPPPDYGGYGNNYDGGYSGGRGGGRGKGTNMTTCILFTPVHLLCYFAVDLTVPVAYSWIRF